MIFWRRLRQACGSRLAAWDLRGIERQIWQDMTCATGMRWNMVVCCLLLDYAVPCLLHVHYMHPCMFRISPVLIMCTQGVCDILGPAEGDARRVGGMHAGDSSRGGPGGRGSTPSYVASGSSGVAGGGKGGKPPKAPGSSQQQLQSQAQQGAGKQVDTVGGAAAGGKGRGAGAQGPGGVVRDLDWFLVDYLCVPKHRSV